VLVNNSQALLKPLFIITGLGLVLVEMKLKIQYLRRLNNFQPFIGANTARHST
jgi:hypothetical protein